MPREARVSVHCVVLEGNGKIFRVGKEKFAVPERWMRLSC